MRARKRESSMKTKRDEEDFEKKFEKPIDFSKAIPNPYVDWARRAKERQEQEHKATQPAGR